MTQAGRPREFDVDVALDAAMQAFWAHGYEATSMADLMAAMDLRKGSIYQAFGDKHTLFLQALSRYLEREADVMASLFATLTHPKHAIEKWLAGAVSVCQCEQSRGCFAVNSVVELGPHDEQVAALLRAHRLRMEKLLAAAIARGQADGDFRRDDSAAALAESLFVFVVGMVATSRGPTTKTRSKRLAASALALVT
jgi:TetR/AcrR family transcriptional repressor of nem operon